MSREIDERIVAMYFDNEDFERNAAKTIETLEELKNSTNMTGVGKGFEVFEEAKKKLNFDKVTQGIGTFKTAVTSAGTVFKKAFNLVSPLDNIYNSLKNFSNKYLTRVIGFDVAHKVESTIENAFRNLTIAPISAGWSQYENTMDSVKTIMSSTGETIDVVKGKLNEMTNYANKTIYSLNDMTSNLGKFTNNGVKLDDATDAMIGLANATADAGQGSAQASAAMYNVSQAIGVGKMTSIDWKSLENANIATVKLKQTFIDAAAAGGQLAKTVEEVNGEEVVKYWTLNDKGKKDKNSMEVTVENFRETLKEGWLDKESMLNTFKIYSGELNENEIMALGFSREEAVRLKQIGEEALTAAQEVRTFSKMMDALKEGVQSTWATSFEYIFGDMEEGTNLWKRLNEEIENVLNKSNETRNNILLSWRGMMLDENGEAKKIEEIYNAKASALEYDLKNGNISLDEYNRQMELLNETIGNTALWTDYRDVAIDAFFEMFNSIKSVVSAIGGAWTDVFGTFNADTLKGITQSFRDFAEKFSNWLGSADDADSRLSKIRRTFAGLFRVVKAGWTIFKSIISAGFAIIKPVIDPILNALATIGDWLDLGNVENLGDAVSKLGQKLSDLWNSLSSLGWSGVFSKIGGWITDLWANIKSGITTWLNDNGLGFVVTWFNNVKTKLEEGWAVVTEWWESSGVGTFFSDLWDTISGWFKSDTGYRYNGSMLEEYTIDAPIIAMFKNAWKSITDAYEEVKSWKIWTTIGDFFKGIWDTVSGLFQAGENGEAAPIVQFFTNIYNWLQTAWRKVSGKISEWWNNGDNGVANFFKGIWETVWGLFQAGENGEAAPIVQFFTNIYNWLKEAWDSVSKKITEWWNAEDGVGAFFREIAHTVIGVFESTDGHKAPIVLFFESIPDAIGTAWESVKNFFTTGAGKDIGNFFTDTWNWLMGLLNIGGSGDNTKGSLFNPMNAMASASGINSPLMGEVQKFTRQATSGETSTSESELEKKAEEVPIVQFFHKIKDALTNAWNAVIKWDGWKSVGQFFSDVWKWIGDTVQAIGEVFTARGTGNAGDTENAEEEMEKGKTFLETVGEFLTGILAAIADVIKEAANSDAARDVVELIKEVVTAIADVIGYVARYIGRAINTIEGEEGGFTAGDWIVTVIVGLLTIVTSITSAVKTKNLAAISEAGGVLTNIGGQMLELSAGILLIALAIKYLGTMNFLELLQGAGAIAVLGVVLAVIFKNITNLSETLTHDAPVTGIERVISKIVTAVGAYFMLQLIMDKLPGIISIISEAKAASGLEGADVLNVMLGLTAVVSGLLLALGLLQKIAPNGLSIQATFNTVVSVLEVIAGIAVGVFGAGGIVELIEGIFGDQAADDLIDSAVKFFNAIGRIGNAFVAGLAGTKTDGQKMESGLTNLEALADVADKFDTETSLGITRILAMMTTLSKTAKEIDTGKMDNFEVAMEHIARGVLKLSWVFDGIEDLPGVGDIDTETYKKYEGVIGLISKIFEAFGQLAVFSGEELPFHTGTFGVTGLATQFKIVLDDFIEFANDDERLSSFVDGLNNIIDAFGGLHDGSNVNFDGLAIVKKMYDAIQTTFDNPSEDLPEFNATPIIDSIVKAIGLGDSVIAQAVHSMVQDGINLLALGTSDMGYDLSGLFSGVTTEGDESGLGNVSSVQEQLDKYLGLDNGEPSPYTLTITPILDFSNFDNEWGKLSEYIQGQVPLNINGTFNLGDQALNINGEEVVNEIRMLRDQMSMNQQAIYSAIGSVESGFGSKFDALSREIAGMKLYLDGNTLVGGIIGRVDSSLYKRAYIAAKTGISVP